MARSRARRSWALAPAGTSQPCPRSDTPSGAPPRSWPRAYRINERVREVVRRPSDLASGAAQKPATEVVPEGLAPTAEIHPATASI